MAHKTTRTSLRLDITTNSTLGQRLVFASQLARDIEPVLDKCWASVVDSGPELHQHWLNVSCLLGWMSVGNDLTVQNSLLNHAHIFMKLEDLLTLGMNLVLQF